LAKGNVTSRKTSEYCTGVDKRVCEGDVDNNFWKPCRFGSIGTIGTEILLAQRQFKKPKESDDNQAYRNLVI